MEYTIEEHMVRRLDGLVKAARVCGADTPAKVRLLLGPVLSSDMPGEDWSALNAEDIEAVIAALGLSESQER